MRLPSAVRDWIGRAFRVALDTPLAVVATFGALAGGVMYRLAFSPPDSCPSLPVSLIRVEVTFDAAKFAALLAAEGAGCKGYAIAGFGWLDVLFSILYPFALAALGVWALRWRYRRPDGSEYAVPALGTWRVRLLTVAPFVAGALDILEDLFLSVAARRIGSGAAGNDVLVFLGSFVSSIKWILLGLWLVGAIAEWLAGPRGRVLRLTRFSTLAVVLGALPLLAVPQGQDILQRLAEANRHPYIRVWFGVVAIVFAATVVWYVSRRLLQRGFDADKRWMENDSLREWLEDFAVNIPRIQGTAMIVLGGLAFARAGMRPLWFLAVAIGGFAIAAWLESRGRKTPAPEGTRAARALDADQTVSARQALREEGAGPRVLAALISSVLGAITLNWPSAERGLLDDAEATVALRMAATGCVIAAWVFFLFVRYRRTVMAARKTGAARRLEATAQTAYSFDGSASQSSGAPARLNLQLSRSVWLALAASTVVLLAFTFVPVPIARFVGPLWVLALFAGNTVLFGSFAVYIYERFAIPVVRIALGFAFLFSLWNENHSIRLLHGPAADTRVPIAERLDRFLAARSGRDQPIVLIAAAGGGLRAAYWTATTLSAIQDGNPAFAKNVFAMSGVSGGSLGVALFDAIVHDGGGTVDQLHCAHDSTKTAIPLPGGYSRCSRVFLRDDFLAPVLAKMVAPDLAQRFFPYPVSVADRSTALEESWEASYDSTTARQTFANGLRALATDTTVPVLILNATHVETGKRYVAGTVTSEDVLLDTRDVLSLLASDIPLSSAVHNSARFTGVSPAGHLDRNDSLERGRVVDGGYFENSGLVTLREVYALIKRRAPTVPVLAVYLCNDPVACHDDTDTQEHTDASSPAVPAQSQKARLDSLAKATDDSIARTHNSWANELLAPVRAVLDARDARGELALAEMRQELDTNFIQLNVCDKLTGRDTSERAKKARDRVVSPPLGWSLSRLATNWMDASMLDAAKDSATGPCPEHNRRMIDRLRRIR